MPPLLRVPDWSRGGGDGARAAGAEGTEVRWGGAGPSAASRAGRKQGRLCGITSELAKPAVLLINWGVRLLGEVTWSHEMGEKS